MRIGIITFHRAYNCGALLQAWALKTVLERMGHIAEFPILNHVGESRRWAVGWRKWPRTPWGFLDSFFRCLLYNAASIPGEDLLRIRFRRFRKCNLVERACNIDDLSDLYDVLIVGSDQVWSSAHTGNAASLFFGETLPVDIKKIAYAVSYGDKMISSERLRRVALAVDNFNHVSARERIVSEQLEDIAKQNIPVTLDPTLLLERHDYQKFVMEKPKSPYLFMYTLDTDRYFVDTAKRIAARLHIPAIIAPMYQKSRLDAPPGLTYGISPDLLVSYVANADYVVSHSFHGTVLPIVFDKPFLSLRLERENEECPSRVGTLLGLTGNLNRLVTPDIPIDEMVARLTGPIAIDKGDLRLQDRHQQTGCRMLCNESCLFHSNSCL